MVLLHGKVNTVHPLFYLLLCLAYGIKQWSIVDVLISLGSTASTNTLLLLYTAVVLLVAPGCSTTCTLSRSNISLPGLFSTTDGCGNAVSLSEPSALRNSLCRCCKLVKALVKY